MSVSSALCLSSTQKPDASNRSPSVLAVAITFAKVIFAYPASTALEFEIRDPCRVLVVEYSVPSRSYQGLRYVPAAPSVGCHLYAELTFIGECIHSEYRQVILVTLSYSNILHGMFLPLRRVVEVEGL